MNGIWNFVSVLAGIVVSALLILVLLSIACTVIETIWKKK